MLDADQSFARWPTAVLPKPSTALIGREQEARAVRSLLQQPQVRLVTFTGPPGVGKTRLCLQVAAEVRNEFPDGVYFVALAAVRDAALVADAIVQCLGLTSLPTAHAFVQLKNVLIDRHLLLLLDNFEQVMAAATLVTDLLANVPGLTIFVTSRAALRLSGEYEYPVLPLALPGLDLVVPNELLRVPAVALFAARAQAVKADFQLTPANAAVVGEICRRLEGLPLAIELAAARTKLLTPSALLTRLANRLATLTSGPRDLPPRQQTLRAALTWSYELLTPHEQLLFRRLALFVNGWTLEAAEAINPLPTEAALQPTNLSTLDALAALLDHSLIQRVETAAGDARFTMLEMIREFGLEALAAAGEQAAARQRHADYYLRQAEAIEPQLYGPDQEQGLNQLEVEHANLRAALAWSASTHDRERLLRLTLTLGQFWWRHGHFVEEQHWLDHCLAFILPLWAAQTLNEQAIRQYANIPDFQAKAAGLLYTAGAFAWHHGDPQQAVALCSKSLTLYRLLDHQHHIARSLRILALAAMDRGDDDQAGTLLAESLVICRAEQDQRGLGWTLSFLGRAAAGQGETDRARLLLQESLAIFRQLGEQDGVIYQLQYLSDVALKLEEWALACQFSEESLLMARQLGHKGGAADALLALGRSIARQSQPRRAVGYLKEALAIYQTLDNPVGTAACYTELARSAAQLGQNQIAGRFHLASGVTQPQGALALPSLTATASDPASLPSLAQALALLEAAANSAAEIAPPVAQEFNVPAAVAQRVADLLTSRELEVLRLIAQGLTYVQIAAQLVVSPRTVDAHLRAIYGKLGVNSRHAAARLAIDQQLI